MNKPLLAGLAFLFLVAGSITLATVISSHFRDEPIGPSGSTGPINYNHGDWRKQEILKEFTLTERSGKKFHSKDMKGKVWVVSFFFSSCTKECNQQNIEVNELHKKHGPRGVTFVSISSDPENDTPAKLRRYADSFSADPKQWLFLTGEPLHIERIAGECFVVAVDVENEAHSSSLIAVDRWGKIRGYFNSQDPRRIGALELLLDTLLTEKEPPPKEKPKVRRPPEELDEDEDEEIPVKSRDEKTDDENVEKKER